MERIAGVDEAGLGPLLGPLVVAGVVLDLPEAEADPYVLLEAVATRAGGRSGPRLLVDDSKRVCSGPHGVERVERSALAFLGQGPGGVPASAVELAGRLRLGGSRADRRGCPWLEELSLALPFAASPGQVELDAWNLGRALKATGLGVVELPIAALHPAGFNQSIEELGNKAETHYREVMAILGRILELRPHRIRVDRTGGRLHHASSLARAFPGIGVTRLEEEKERQGYRLQQTGRPPIEVWFLERAEECCFTVALASCLAKYVREVFMECLNRWCASRLPGLRPTRGYVQDGRRFLKEARRLFQDGGVPEAAYLRSR